MFGGIGDMKVIGGFVIWSFKGFKGSFNECITNYKNSYLVGIITVLIVAFLCIYFYDKL
jgi:hypothetical protein